MVHAAPHNGPALDTEAQLADLVLTADPEALADLKLRALAPLEQFRPAARAKLEETLRSWLLHMGRREAVAEALFVQLDLNGSAPLPVLVPNERGLERAIAAGEIGRASCRERV